YFLFYFFFQAEDGIRDRNVTGVQTCALPILTEWIHRLIAASTGVLIVATAIASWKVQGSHIKIRITGTLAGVFAVSQIALGAIVIDTKLHAVIVAIHNGVGILLFAMTLLTVIFAFRLSHGATIKTSA